ncbi:MAG TPA: class I SAM-dependent methyltransferase [Planctomycetota bacterium]|nr:class I SAM-dependent methyltransferase [Planctomycetota bacterium]
MPSPRRSPLRRAAKDVAHTALDAAAALGRAAGWLRPRTRGIEDIDLVVPPDDELRAEWAALRPGYLLLHRMAAACAPRSIVEIGVRRGASAFALLSAAPQAEYLGLDADVCTWGGVPGALWDARRMLRREFPRARITVRRQDTAAAGLRLPAADLYFVDGDHSREGCARDLALCAAAADPARGALLLVDDVTHERGVAQAVEEFARARGLQPMMHPTLRGLAAFALPARG